MNVVEFLSQDWVFVSVMLACVLLIPVVQVLHHINPQDRQNE